MAHWFVPLAIVLGLVMVEWPMFKGIIYAVTGLPARPSAVAWRTDLDAALAEARRTGKPVLADFSAEWCPSCQTMKREVWTDVEVGHDVERLYVPVAVDVDQNRAVAGRYGITSIPTILILDAAGKVRHRADFMSRQELIDFLSRSTG